MTTFHVYAIVSGTKYLGTVEAENNNDAEEKAFDLSTASVNLCHACTKQCDGAEISSVYVEED